jgi:cold shock CspA family protein
MKKGIIIHWDSAKTFGFIRDDAGGADIFFGRDVVTAGMPPLKKGTVVEFEDRESEKKPGKRDAVTLRVAA